MKEGVRRMFFHEVSGPDGVFNLGSHEGQIFAAVYMKDQSCVEWALKQDNCRMWKLKCFKYFLLRLSDLETVLKREREPEEMARVTRAEGLAEGVAQEEMRVVEKHRIRSADMDEDSEMERMVAIGEQSEAARCDELAEAEVRERQCKAVQDGTRMRATHGEESRRRR